MKLLTLLAALLIATASAAQSPLEEQNPATATDSSDMYGLIPEVPVKVGGAFKNGVENQHRYLAALRDAQGNPVTYSRQGSCCPYESVNAVFGHALVDKYQVKYRDENNKKRKTIIYISFYDYVVPRAVKGFTLDTNVLL